MTPSFGLAAIVLQQIETTRPGPPLVFPHQSLPTRNLRIDLDTLEWVTQRNTSSLRTTQLNLCRRSYLNNKTKK